MKRSVTYVILLLFLFTGHSFAQNSLKVMTFNIRFANPDDGTHRWEFRKSLVDKTIAQQSPDILCIQEGLYSQVKDLEKAFPAFSRVGVGRDDGNLAGEFSAVFFNHDRLKMMTSSTFWLSQTPEVAGSRGWDAACNRVVTWIQLKDQKNGMTFFVFNTHFDHMGEVARTESARLLLDKIVTIAGKAPFVVTGDFNGNENSVPYQILVKSNAPKLANARYASENKSTGPDCSFIGFGVKFVPGEVIDHIFVNEKTKVIHHQIIDTNEAGFYPSDHLPVMAELIFR